MPALVTVHVRMEPGSHPVHALHGWLDGVSWYLPLAQRCSTCDVTQEQQAVGVERVVPCTAREWPSRIPRAPRQCCTWDKPCIVCGTLSHHSHRCWQDSPTRAWSACDSRCKQQGTQKHSQRTQSTCSAPCRCPACRARNCAGTCRRCCTSRTVGTPRRRRCRWAGTCL